ncbi:MAG: deoxyguanosinetriphosphate triphosphohydrolase [Lachnospiraceae bacterium]|nr:deoxyguanosinetriphosphate triphosphohydrolase [Lachnospiraceae bacterium]
MTIRELMEEREYRDLRPCASHSDTSRGRKTEEEPCDVRTCYQRDRDRILHCKSFRRLKNKTQVFLKPDDDHYRTRLTHTLEVSQIARTIAKALFLNEDLTEAIALGHDLGHTPYGHAGEQALDERLKEFGFIGFHHADQSVRVVDVLEKDGRGLNLTWEVLDGIRNHGTDRMPHTLEGKIVRLSDKIAYVNHDIDDALRAGVLKQGDLPKKYTDILGHTVKSRLNRMIHDVIENSMDKDDILVSDEVFEAIYGLRAFMFENVYYSEAIRKEENKAQHVLNTLFSWYLEHPEKIPESYIRHMEKDGPEIVTADYVSGMTDQYAVQKYMEIFVP